MFLVANVPPSYKAPLLFQLLQRAKRCMQHWRGAGNSDLASSSKFVPIVRNEKIINQPGLKIVHKILIFFHTPYVGRKSRNPGESYIPTV